jgi:hypothetical protein
MAWEGVEKLSHYNWPEAKKFNLTAYQEMSDSSSPSLLALSLSHDDKKAKLS